MNDLQALSTFGSESYSPWSSGATVGWNPKNTALVKNIANSRGTNLVISTYTPYNMKYGMIGTHHKVREPRGIKLRKGTHQASMPEVAKAPMAKTYTNSAT